MEKKKEFYKYLSNEKVKINWNKNPIEIKLFVQPREHRDPRCRRAGCGVLHLLRDRQGCTGGRFVERLRLAFVQPSAARGRQPCEEEFCRVEHGDGAAEVARCHHREAVHQVGLAFVQGEPEMVEQGAGERKGEGAQQQPRRREVGQRGLQAAVLAHAEIHQVGADAGQDAPHERAYRVVREEVEETDSPRHQQQADRARFGKQQGAQQPDARRQINPVDPGCEFQPREQ